MKILKDLKELPELDILQDSTMEAVSTCQPKITLIR